MNMDKINQKMFIEDIFLYLEKPKYCRDSSLVKKNFPYSNNFTKLSYTPPFRILTIDAIEFILKILKVLNIKSINNLENVSFIKQLLINRKILGLISSLTRSFLFPKKVTYGNNNNNYDYILAICIKKSIGLEKKTILPGFGILLKSNYLRQLKYIDNFILLHYQMKKMSFL